MIRRNKKSEGGSVSFFVDDAPEFNLDEIPWIDMPNVTSEEDAVAFDRGICAAGVKIYRRRRSDHECAGLSSATEIVVEERAPGCRVRHHIKSKADSN